MDVSTKISINALLITLFFLASSSYINAAEKSAIMMEIFEDSLTGMIRILSEKYVAKSKTKMGEAGKGVENRNCIQNISTNKSSIKMIAQYMAEEAAEGGQYNDIKSVSLIDTCPLPATAYCDHGSRIEYYYTNSSKLLDGHKEGYSYQY